MTISKSLDERFIDWLREIIDEQQKHIDCLNYDVSDNTKKSLKLIDELQDIALENKKLLEDLNRECYFLEKLNIHLELEVTGKIPRFEVDHGQKRK
jgi:hypothetical protein